MHSTHLSILQAVANRIRRLNLAEIPENQVAVLKTFTPEVIEALPGLPAVVVSLPAKGQVSDEGGTNERDDFGYPVQISLVARDDQDNAETVRFDRHVAWQERIRRALHRRALPEAGCVFTSRMESQQPLDPSPWRQRNLWVSVMVVRFVSRESRVKA
jgi:hypothetical protein